MPLDPKVWNNWPKPQAKGIGDARMAAFFAPGGYVAGSGAAAWSGDRYQQVLRYTGWNYIGTKVIGEAIAGLMPQVGFVRGQQQAEERKRLGKKMLSQFNRRKALTSAQAQHEIEGADPDHGLVQLLQNPNKPDVAWTFFFRTVIFLELTGNAYWWKIRNPFGQVIQMYVLPAHWMRAVGGKDELVDSYEVRPFGGYGGAKSQVVLANDVVHFAYPGPLSVIDGWAPTQAGALWSDTASSIDIARMAAMKQGVRSDLLLALDPSIKDPDDKVINRFLGRIAERNAGEVNSGTPMVFPGGVKPHQIGRAVAEMDFVDSSNQVARDWLLALRRVSKTLAGITEDVNFASMLASLASFMQLTIKPKLMMIGQIATEGLAKEFGKNVIIFYPDPTPADPAQKNADITTDSAVGATDPNEVRRERGKEPYPHGGDDPMLPMGTSSTGWNSGDLPENEPVNFEGDSPSIDEPDTESENIDGEPATPAPAPKHLIPINRLAALLDPPTNGHTHDHVALLTKAERATAKATETELRTKLAAVETEQRELQRKLADLSARPAPQPISMTIAKGAVENHTHFAEGAIKSSDVSVPERPITIMPAPVTVQNAGDVIVQPAPVTVQNAGNVTVQPAPVNPTPLQVVNENTVIVPDSDLVPERDPTTGLVSRMRRVPVPLEPTPEIES